MDSALVDPLELLAKIEAQIMKANEESTSRKDIMERISKWHAACDEENWLEEYSMDSTKYSAGRGAHFNLRRAEKARILVRKIPAIIDNLITTTLDWEDEKKKPFLYDGVRLVTILEEYKLTRQQKEEEQTKYRDHKKLQALMIKEREQRHGSKPSNKRSNSHNDRRSNGYHANKGLTPAPRQLSAGNATPELLTPQPYSGHDNVYLKEMKTLSATPLNIVAASMDDSVSTFTYVTGSELESPPPR